MDLLNKGILIEVVLSNTRKFLGVLKYNSGKNRILSLIDENNEEVIIEYDKIVYIIKKVQTKEDKELLIKEVTNN